jgi:hypothetical protein
MANEISMGAYLKLSKGGRTPHFECPFDTFTQTGTDYFKGTQTATTTTAALEIGRITQPGLMLLKNLDSSNWIEMAGATFVADSGVIQVLAGEWCLFRWKGTTPFIRANSADVEVDYLLLEA